MQRKLLLSLVMGMMIALIVAGCSNESSTTEDTETEEGPPTTSADDDTLTIAMGVDLLTFDFHDVTNTTNEAVTDNVFNYLFKRNFETDEVEPELAESYELIDDLTWEVKLKQGVLFHNGDEFTAKDVKFTLERIGNDESLATHSGFRSIEEVEIIDDYTVQIKTDVPTPFLIASLSKQGAGMMPATYIEENGMDHFLSNPVGTGPYKFVEWVRDSQIVFEKFEDYFEGDVTDWQNLVFRVIPENSTRVSELLTGGVDVAVNIPPADWERIEEAEGVHMSRGPSNRTLMIFLRSTEGYPTSDQRVREAIDLAIDNGAITEHVLKGAGVPTLTRLGPGNFGHNPAFHDTYNYDPERAAQLLAEAGYPDGFEMTLHSPRGRYLQDAEVAEVIAGMLSQVGITVNIEFMEWSAFTELRDSNEHKDAYLFGLGNTTFDGENALDWYRGDRFVGHTDYRNEELDDLLAAARVNMDPEEREAQYQRIQEIIVEDTAHITLHHETINIGLNDRIDFTPTPDEFLYAPFMKKN